jgi:hypothetical protein
LAAAITQNGLIRESIVFALKQAGGKIFGPNGAAELLGMKPTTLTFRIVLGLNQKTGDGQVAPIPNC